jgi:hypothetical protein
MRDAEFQILLSEFSYPPVSRYRLANDRKSRIV